MSKYVSLNGVQHSKFLDAEISNVIECVKSHLPKGSSGNVLMSIQPDSRNKNQYSVMIKASALTKPAIIHCHDENLFKAIHKAQRKIIFQIERLKKKVLKKRKSKSLRHAHENWAI